MATTVLDDALELAGLLRPAWAQINQRLRASGVPLCDGDADESGDGSGDGDADGTGSGDADGSGDGDGSGDASGEGSGDGAGDGTDWKAEARKHERRAKQERKDRETLAAKLKEFEDRDKTDQQKAIDKAREEGAAETSTKFEVERRRDRLEVGVTRLAAKGIKIGDGDKAKTVKFADPEDALVHIERAITNGDVDTDDIFDKDGKVQTAGLTTALEDLLERKPHLALADTGGPRGKGDADLGKGASGAGDKDLESMSPEDHFKKIRRRA